MVEETNKSKNNARHLAVEMKWLSEMITYRLKSTFDQDENTIIQEPAMPILEEPDSVYSRFVQMYRLNKYERLTLILSLVPYIDPALLDAFFVRDKEKGRTFTRFGGVQNSGHSGFIPTGETLLYIAAGAQLDVRFQLLRLFEGDHIFARHNVLQLVPSVQNDPFLSGALVPSREFIDLFTTANIRKPVFGSNFPAKEIKTTYEWDDLVLDHRTVREINELKAWVEYSKVVMEEWGLERKLKPGYLSLFYGPPGTGKTLTATLLAKALGKPIYRIDLSMIVSKYIGETEKNLSGVFDQAENKDWILFFDEADALFGKRTKVNDAHDRYANQEVSYLLQRIEDFSGLVILASNLKSNMDEAFTRRFQSVIHFPVPTAGERMRLWRKSFSEKTVLEEAINMEEISKKFEISGGSIMNVVRYSSLMAVSRGENIIRKIDLIEGINREYRKEGKLA